MRDALAAAARMLQLVVQRREPAWVRRDPSGGWRQHYRRGTLVTPGLRAPTWTHYVAAASDFCAFYTPQAGDVVVELGAGTGTETVLLARLVGPHGRVVACEAHPATARLLRRTVECNRLTNVDVVECAIASSSGEVTMSDQDVTGVANAIAPGPLVVSACTFDDLVADLGLERIDFLKVNIEGAESAVAEATASAWGLVRHAVISCHDFRADRGDGEQFRTGAAVRSALRSAGFAIFALPDHPLPWVRDYVYARRPEN